MSWFTCLMVLMGYCSFAQVQNYNFTQSATTYENLTDPAVLATATALTGTGSIDDQVYTLSANTLPFGFSINGTSYTSLNVYANGFVSFGSTTTNNSSPVSSSTTYNAVVSAMATDLHALYGINGLTGDISYKTVGTAPNRVFVIQWKHFRPYNGSTSAASYWDWNFQIRLKEDNTIAIVYDIRITGTPTSGNTEVGLRGSSNSDYNNRTGTGVTGSNWTQSAAGTLNSSRMTSNSATVPSSGLTYNWAPPAPCQAPAAQPTNLTLTNNGIIITGSFTAASPAADRYLILRTPAGVTPTPPTNGVTYTTGNSTALNAYISYYGANTTLENNYSHGIRGNNEYTFTIYAASSACSGGPLYLTANPLTASITNCPATVNGITNADITTNSFRLNWPAPENGTARPLQTIVEVATNSTFQNQVTGSPFTLDSTQLSLALTGLSANTQYFYRAKSVGSTCESSYSSTNSLYTGCVAVSDFYENFDAVTGLALPNCWSKIIVAASGSTPTINVTTTDASSQPNNVSFYGNGSDTDLAATKIILVSPEVTNLAAGTHRLRFKARKTSTTVSPSATSLQIVALDSNTANANIEVIATFNELTLTYAEYNAYFDTYRGAGRYIGVRRIGGPTYSYLYVDDLIWEPIPACPDLVSLTATNITPNGVTVTLNNPAGTIPANGYEYVVSTTNTPPAVNDVPTTTNAATITVTTLQSGVNYYFWARRVCSVDEKSPWKPVSFTTIMTKPAPWAEPFATATATPAGWTTTGWILGTARGAVGNTGNNIYKNLFGSAASGNFTTVPVGPLDANNYELSFDYKQSNYNTPYAALTDWGNFTIEVSTDFGTTWTSLATVTNEAGTGNYIHKTYSLSANANQYVKVRVTGNRTAGDFDLSFDNFEIKPGEPISCFTWAGTTSTSWNTASNWCGGAVPTATSNVIIANTATSPVIAAGTTAYAHNLTVNAGATLIVNTGATLSVENTVTAIGTLTIQNNGALIQGASAVTNTNSGIVTAIKNSNPLYRLDYTLWSSPVSGTQTLGAFSPETSAGRFYEYKYDLDTTTNTNAEQYFIVSPATVFEAAKGYLIRMPNGNLSVPGYNGGTASYSYTGVFTGTPNNGTVTRAASTQGNRYTAVGNPYPSPISVVDFFTANAGVIDASSGLYFWRKRNNATATSYATLTLAAYTANGRYSANQSTGGGSEQAVYFQGAEANWLISQGQGFFVKTANVPTGSNITFNNAMRRPAPTNGNQAFLRTAATTKSRFWLNLTDNQGGFSQTAIAYMDNATPGLDYGYDGKLLNDGGVVALYSIAENTNLSIQARQAFVQDDTVTLGFTATIAGQFTIGLDHADGLFEQGQDIYVKDKLLGTVNSLDSDYTFTSETGTFNDRFEIVYTTNALNVDVPLFNANSVIVFKDGNNININAGTINISDVTIYDINGRKLYTQNTDGTSTSIANLQIAQQVIIVEVNTAKGKVSKRIVF